MIGAGIALILVLGIGKYFSGSGHHREMMSRHAMMGNNMMRMAPAPPTARKPPGSVTSQAIQQFCSGCHAAPDPAQHTAQEWPAIVARMKQHMVRMGRKLPDSQQLGDIIDFLQSHASAHH